MIIKTSTGKFFNFKIVVSISINIMKNVFCIKVSHVKMGFQNIPLWCRVSSYWHIVVEVFLRFY